MAASPGPPRFSSIFDYDSDYYEAAISEEELRKAFELGDFRDLDGYIIAPARTRFIQMMHSKGKPPLSNWADGPAAYSGAPADISYTTLTH